MFKRVLVPLDGSPQSAAALPLARVVARSTGAAITLLQVVPDTDETGQQRAAEVSDNLRKIAFELSGAGVKVDTVVRRGEAAEQILQQVAAESADLIVMRTHGRAGVGRLMLGSVTEKVLTHSNVPLLLLRPGGRRITAIHSLLVPVDGSPGGAMALGTAVRLAKDTGAEIRLVEVAVPIPTYIYAASGPYDGAPYVDPAWDEEALASAQSYVARIATRLRAGGLTVESEARVGSSVPGTIVSVADQDKVDLVVMSTAALTGPVRALLGSTTDAVVRTAHCPVLVVHRSAGGRELGVVTQATAGPVT